MADREPTKWITVNGKHVPIYEDGDGKKEVKKTGAQKYAESQGKTTLQLGQEISKNSEAKKAANELIKNGASYDHAVAIVHKQFFEKKSKEDKLKDQINKEADEKEKQIAKNKAEKDKLNKSEGTVKKASSTTKKHEAMVEKHLGRIVWNKVAGTDGQAEVAKEPVQGVSIEKFCEIASRLDKKYDYDFTHDTSKFMGQTVNHYYIIRERK